MRFYKNRAETPEKHKPEFRSTRTGTVIQYTILNWEPIWNWNQNYKVIKICNMHVRYLIVYEERANIFKHVAQFFPNNRNSQMTRGQLAGSWKT